MSFPQPALTALGAENQCGPPVPSDTDQIIGARPSVAEGYSSKRETVIETSRIRRHGQPQAYFNDRPTPHPIPRAPH